MPSQTTTKTCISCGMPMLTAEEHAAGDLAKEYCKACATAGGELKTREEVARAMAGFLRKTQGLDETVARRMAEDMMSTLPAWSRR